MICMMFATKEASENTPGGVDGMLSRMDKMEKGMGLMDVKEHNNKG